MPRDAARQWIANLFQNQWKFKLLALAMAALTYYAIRSATDEEKDFVVPVEVELNPGIAVLAKNPDQVEVRFRGALDDILKIDQTRLKAQVRVPDATLGGRPQPVIITGRDILGARGVAVTMIDPPRVMITFDHEVEATFSVAKLQTIGEPLLGKVELQYSPQSVTIRGPKTRIEELKREGHDQVIADPVDVDGRVESFSKRMVVRSPGGSWASKIEPSEITVEVTIIKKSVTRAWSSLPVLAIRGTDAAGRVAVEPSTVDIMLEGRSELLESISERDIRIFVDCEGLSHDATNSVPVQVHLPVFMDVTVSAVPKTVSVSFPKE
ncbi:MAG: CdaR family protein [Verrucomicrobia bacterium]|nr:CdaR family protein [Verrucomicrobiota bacterium]